MPSHVPRPNFFVCALQIHQKIGHRVRAKNLVSVDETQLHEGVPGLEPPMVLHIIPPPPWARWVWNQHHYSHLAAYFDTQLEPSPDANKPVTQPWVFGCAANWLYIVTNWSMLKNESHIGMLSECSKNWSSLTVSWQVF